MLGYGRQNDVANTLIQAAQAERDARMARIKTAWQRYDGQAPDSLKKTDTDPDAKDNASVNMSRRTVDIGAFYCFGKGLAFEVGEDGDKGDEALEEWLQACWKANRQGTFLLEYATSAGVTGDGIVRVYPPRRGEEFPRIVSLDAQNVDADWSGDDCTDVWRYVLQFNSVDLVDKVAVAHRTLIVRSDDKTRWSITEQESSGQGSGWLTVSEEDWKYPFAPLFHAKNRAAPHSFWGVSDIEEDVLKLNGAINFVLSNINRILRVHGHPTLYIAGKVPPGTEIDRAVDAILNINDPQGKIGAVPYVEDLTAHFSQLQKLRDAYHELTSVPEIATGKLENVGQLSGLALQILYGPLTQLVEVKRLFHGEMLVELSQALCVLGGKVTRPGDVDVKIQWPQVLPVDRKAEADTALSLQTAGVSKDTTLKELGYDPDEEADKRKNDAQTIGQQVIDQFNAGKNDPAGDDEE